MILNNPNHLYNCGLLPPTALVLNLSFFDHLNRPVFLMPLQQYQELISVLQFQVTNYCIRICATTILQDAESHYWDDYKAFYEV